MNNSLPNPSRPSHIPDYADDCLHALAKHNLGGKISLGGAFALLHYLDYRSTFDVDAWWHPSTTSKEREQVIQTLVAVLEVYGRVRRRSFGDVTSIELDTEHRKKSFSFQIAERSAQLQPSVSAQWTNVLLDSFSDLIASKMTALIQRGAPRDFRDIYAICQSGMATLSQCWQLWQQRQELAGDEADVDLAKVALDGHLERIEQYRPLATIADPEQREQANRLRAWYREEFLNGRLV